VGDRSSGLRPSIAFFLRQGKYSRMENVGPILQRVLRLTRHSNPEAQRDAVWVIFGLLKGAGPRPSSEATRFLTEPIGNDASNAGERAEAVEALRSLVFGAEPAPEHRTVNRTVIDAVAGSLRTADKPLRLAAGRFLGQCGNPARPALPDLVAALADSDPELIATLASAVLQIGPTEAAVPGLLACGKRLVLLAVPELLTAIILRISLERNYTEVNSLFEILAYTQILSATQICIYLSLIALRFASLQTRIQTDWRPTTHHHR
jgi:hypothetical protein